MNPNLSRHDEIYERLVSFAEALDEAALRRFHMRLILLLCDLVGDAERIFEAMALAAEAGTRPPSPPPTGA